MIEELLRVTTPGRITASGRMVSDGVLVRDGDLVRLHPSGDDDPIVWTSEEWSTWLARLRWLVGEDEEERTGWRERVELSTRRGRLVTKAQEDVLSFIYPLPGRRLASAVISYPISLADEILTLFPSLRLIPARHLHPLGDLLLAPRQVRRRASR